MSEFDKCPHCGGEMMLVRRKEHLILCCMGCPLEYGRYWYTRKRDLRRAWNKGRKNDEP